MVELAEIALQRCVHRNYKTNEKRSKEVTEIHYSFEFLDDFIIPKPPLITCISDMLKRKSKKDDTVHCEVPMTAIPTVQYPYEEMAKDESVLECEDAESWMLKNFTSENHPLELMVCDN